MYVSIALILISGIYNVAMTIADKPVLYHILFGLKLVAALAVFFIASAMVGRSAAFEQMRANARKWSSIVVLLALVIVLISGVLKGVPDKPLRVDQQMSM